MMLVAMVLASLRSLPRPLVAGVAALLVLLLMWHWHAAMLDRAFAAGAASQAANDRARFDAAATAAAAAQGELVARLLARQIQISKGSDDALLARNADLNRRYDELGLRWAAYRADRGHAGDGRATALPDAAAGVDAAACAAAGWVSFDTAAAAAHAADTAIAKDDAWIAWTHAQAVAWPD